MFHVMPATHAMCSVFSVEAQFCYKKAKSCLNSQQMAMRKGTGHKGMSPNATGAMHAMPKRHCKGVCMLQAQPVVWHGKTCIVMSAGRKSNIPQHKASNKQAC